MVKKEDKNKDSVKESEKKEEVSNDKAARRIIANAQYVKDLSFESPNAPLSLQPQKEQPKIGINVDVITKKINDESFEVTLNINAKAASGEKAMFVVELSYAGIFTVKGLDDKEKEAILMIYCPSIIFPFARRVISDTVRDGGFPPLMIDPIDFSALYQKQKENAAKKEEKA